MAGNCIAVLRPDERGVTLIDAAVGHAAPQARPRRATRSWAWSPTRPAGGCVTIEQAARGRRSRPRRPCSAGVESRRRASSIRSTSGTWTGSTGRSPTLDPGHPVRRGTRAPRPAPPDRPPLVAISPDGKTIAVAPCANERPSVRLFSAEDGSFKPARTSIDNQIRGVGPGAGAQWPDGRGRARPECGSTTWTTGGPRRGLRDEPQAAA